MPPSAFDLSTMMPAWKLLDQAGLRTAFARNLD